MTFAKKIIPLTPNNMQLEGYAAPRDIEAEAAVLGAVLIEENAVHDAMLFIRSAEYFYQPAHQHIWQSILELQARNAGVDMLTVADQLRKTGKLEAAGGHLYVSQLTNKVGSSANLPNHAAIVAERYVQRCLLKTGMEMMYRATQPEIDAFEALSLSATAIDNINQQVSGQGEKSFYDRVIETGNELLEQSKHPDVIMGIPTGIHKLDLVILGWQLQDLVILAARPAMGKTGFALGTAIAAAKHFQALNAKTDWSKRKAAGFISLEMSDKALIKRELAKAAKVSVKEIQTGKIDDYTRQRIGRAILDTAELPFHLCDEGGMDIIRMRSLITTWVRKYGVQLVVVDYLQLVTVVGGKGGNREQDVSTISRTLKALAKNLNITIIALSQLSRSVETRGGDKVPILSDLRESGAIEQDADMVIFLHRPEYYGIEEYEDGESTKDRADAHIAKFREGQPQPVPMRFIGKLTQFTDIDHIDYIEPPPSAPKSKLGGPYVDYTTSQREIENEDDLPF